MTKQGNAWAIAAVEDLAGSIECMFLPATYQLVSTQLVEDTVGCGEAQPRCSGSTGTGSSPTRRSSVT